MPRPAGRENKRREQAEVLSEIGNSSSGFDKRRRVSDFAHGAIQRIKAVHFLTYNSVEIFPGPNLNLIVGANGTGKSTLVCAICLALAGKTSVLGRAGQIADYVQHGYDKARIEVEICNEEGDNWVISREINKQGASVWTLNNRQSTLKAVEETVKKLNIQIGNLCQFLPQDRVADFVKMSSVELLENTQNAIGVPELFDKHCKLKNLRARTRELETNCRANSDLLEKETQRNLQLEGDVKNYNERKKYLELIKVLNNKRKWVEYDIVRESFHEKRKQKESMEAEIKMLTKNSDPLKQKEVAAAQVAADRAKELTDLSVAVTEKKKAIDSAIKNIESYSDKVAAIVQQLNGKLQDEEQRKNRILAFQQQLEGLEQDLARIESADSEDIQTKLNEVNAENSEVNKALATLQSDKENVKLTRIALERDLRMNEQELQRAADIGSKRLEVLRQKSQHAYQAVNWLRSNKDKFSKTIHEPIMMTINVRDQQFAKYVESHIPFDDLMAFVCEDKDDLENFMKVLKDEQHLRINTVLVPNRSLDSFKPKRPLESVKQYGFKYFMKDLFEAPEGVLTYLCSLYNIHDIPVGNQYTEDNIETVLKESGFSRIYTANRIYITRKSRHAPGVQSTVSMEINRPNILTMSVDNERITHLRSRQQDLQQNLEKLKHETLELDEQEKQLLLKQEQLRKQKKELMTKRDEKKNVVARIRQKRELLQKTENEGINIEAEKKQAEDAISKINKERLHVLKQITTITKCLLELSEKMTILAFRHSNAVFVQQKLKKEYEMSTEALKMLEKSVVEMAEDVRKTKDEGHKLLSIAKQASGIGEKGKLPENLVKEYMKLPSTLDEIDTQIHEEQAKADCMLQTDENVIRDYQKRKEAIHRMTNQKEANDQTLKMLQEEIEKIRAEWLPPLEKLIEDINKNFSLYFASLSCAGEVSLSKGENPDDFEKYGISIRVKYREAEQLRELTAHHQSGGERSVATILYLLSLQELTSVPFRCVDEINQGMDSTNERKVFDLIVKTACSKKASQYFLLTPKLLPNLSYSPNMAILFIYNGGVLPVRYWNLKKFVKNQRKALAQ